MQTWKMGSKTRKFMAVALVLALLASLVLDNGGRRTEAAGKKQIKTLEWKRPAINSLTMQRGTTYQIKGRVTPDKATVTYRSSKQSVATVTPKGRITARRKGKAVVTATAKYGTTKRIRLAVTIVPKLIKAKKVQLDRSEMTLFLDGASEQRGGTLVVAVQPKNATNRKVVYRSTDKKVVTVTKKGKVEAKGEGTATITAYAADGRGAKATCVVTVKRRDGVMEPSRTPTQSPTMGSTPTVNPLVSPSVSLPASPSASPATPPTASPSANPPIGPTPHAFPTIDPDAPPELGDPLDVDYENGFVGRQGGGEGEIITYEEVDGVPTWHVTNRGSFWHGATIDLSDVLVAGTTYEISAEVKHTGTGSVLLDNSFQIKDTEDGGDRYPLLTQATAEASEWKLLRTTTTIPSFYSIQLYYQAGKEGDESYGDLYIRNVTVRELKKDISATLSCESMAELAAQYGFSLGTVIDFPKAHEEDFIRVLSKHFNSVTAANEMKAYVLDQAASMASAQDGDGTPRMDFSKADKIMEVARDNGIKVRGHVLVWDSSVPEWFFREGYESDGALVDGVTMKARLESYIKQVLEHYQTEFPDVIYAWDVVNEAVSDGTGEAETGDATRIRKKRGDVENLFYTTLGRDYVKLSFEYVRKYADEGVTLFYNDYNCFYPEKRDAICTLVEEINEEEKLIDGIGMQGYFDRSDGYLKSYANKRSPSVPDAVNAFHDLGMEVHFTELTVRNGNDKNPNNAAAHTKYFGELFQVIKELNRDEAKITNVSIWGLVDAPEAGRGSYTYQLSGTYFGLLDYLYRPKGVFAKVYNILLGAE